MDLRPDRSVETRQVLVNRNLEAQIPYHSGNDLNKGKDYCEKWNSVKSNLNEFDIYLYYRKFHVYYNHFGTL